MHKVVELYQRKAGFSEYRRNELAAVENVVETDQLKELRARKARLVAEIDAEIAQVKLRLAQQGQPASPTARKAAKAEELRKEKRQLDHDFALAVQDLERRGTSVPSIVTMCGANSPSMFYQALNYTPPETVRMSMTSSSFKPDEHNFEYSDFTNLHRYALNGARTVVKMHDSSDPDNVLYVRRQDSTALLGDTSLMSKYDSERVDLLADVLDGSVDTEGMRERPNPYKQ